MLTIASLPYVGEHTADGEAVFEHTRLRNHTGASNAFEQLNSWCRHIKAAAEECLAYDMMVI